MIDIHSHILPDVDDGAANVYESIEMLEAAKKAGVDAIVCTPHCRDPYFDFDMMWDAYEKLTKAVPDFDFRMGFEVNFDKLMSLGDLDYWVPRLAIQGPSLAGNRGATLLLELSTRATAGDFVEYLRVIRQIQAMGYDVVIAHPERYQAIQKDLDLARALKTAGCKLQASSDFISGGRLGKEKKPAKKMFQAGLYDYIASDAHVPEHYEALRSAVDTYGICGPLELGMVGGINSFGLRQALVGPEAISVVTPGVAPVEERCPETISVVTSEVAPVPIIGSGAIPLITPAHSTKAQTGDASEMKRPYKPRHMKTK